ncbi:MAG: hypothetical protein HC836_34440 [Richelia sp. RM2_1_2]|nr:hypothetical protein [Richelia sp. RM2_1_2]
MNSITVNDGNTSPFDQLKKIDELGTEYWLATDLLASMGYRTWKRIKDTVERAIFSARNSGINVSYHLPTSSKWRKLATLRHFEKRSKIISYLDMPAILRR